MEIQKLLKKAQDTYGYSNQISVSAEELCELAAVLNKYIRFPSHAQAMTDPLRNKVIEEFADVAICMEHIQMIFEITPEEKKQAMDRKLIRLDRWLNNSDSIYETVLDREV